MNANVQAHSLVLSMTSARPSDLVPSCTSYSAEFCPIASVAVDAIALGISHPHLRESDGLPLAHVCPSVLRRPGATLSQTAVIRLSIAYRACCVALHPLKYKYRPGHSSGPSHLT